MRDAITNALKLSICAATLLAPVIAWPQSIDGAKRGSTLSFEIPSQPLDSALLELSKQAAIQVLISGHLPQHTAPRISGTMSIAEALGLLLKDTAIGYKWVGEHTLAVVPRVVPSPASSNDAEGSTLGERRGTGEREREEPPSASFWNRLRLAQVDQGHTASDSSVEQSGSASHKTAVALEEIIVTGSHIRGGVSSTGAKVIVLDRKAIEATGYATVHDVLKTIPQNFDTVRPEISGGAGNFNHGVGINLRGLGTGATLTLLNGRRLAAGGDGDFVDVSSIPASAIERIEVLADGASALYGSDAVAGVVNIVLRRDLEGAETQIRIASADRNYEEILVGQVLGWKRETLDVLLGYQYYERTALSSSDLRYAANADKRPFGGTDFRDVFSTPANIADPFTFAPLYAVPAGQDGRNLTAADFVPGNPNLQSPQEGADLLPENQSHSAYFVATKTWGDRLTTSLEAQFRRRDYAMAGAGLVDVLFVPESNAYYVNPTGVPGPVTLFYNFFDDLGNPVSSGTTKAWNGALGFELGIGETWQLRGHGAYAAEEANTSTDTLNRATLASALSDSNPATAFNPFGDGSFTNPQTLERIRAAQLDWADSSIRSGNLTAEGPLFALQGADVRLAAGVDYRDERLHSSRSVDVLNRQVAAVFGEVSLPLLAPLSGSQEPLLAASIAGRYEDYSDFGTTFNPKAGVRLTPRDWVSARATWGTSFRAPRLFEMSSAVVSGALRNLLVPLRDPTVARNVVVLLRTGNNPNLKEETADSWTVGLDFGGRTRSDVGASVTYYDIDYKDRILKAGPVDSSQVLVQEALWGEIITRNPTPDQLAGLCTSLARGSCTTTPPVAIVDQRLRNIARFRVQGLDLNLDVPFTTDIGQFRLGLNGNYVLSYEQQLSRAAPELDLLGIAFNPLDLRLRGMLSWTRGGLTADIAANYSDSYRESNLPTAAKIDSWLTVDLGASYEFAGSAGWLQGTGVALRGVNVLDEDPPFLDVPFGFDAANANPQGRLLSLQISKAW